MTKVCVVIDKKTNKKKVNVNVCLKDYYKKCGFRNDKNFEFRNSWKVKDEGEDKYVSVFAKNNGRANSENKFELPPPLDNELYFGSILIVLHKEKEEYESIIQTQQRIIETMTEKIAKQGQTITNFRNENEKLKGILQEFSR